MKSQLKKYRYIPQTYILKTDAVSEPILLADVKKHLRVESDCTDDDDYINGLIKAARKFVENYTGRKIGLQTMYMYQDSIGYETWITKMPVGTITAFEYKDEDGVYQDVPEYWEDLNSEPVRLEIDDIPTLYEDGYQQIRVEFTTGYTTCPEPLKQAMYLIIGHWYENRQDVVTGTQVNEVPQASQYLMEQYKVYEFC
jgi:uncharacterized phiE125 gp8 family phage protein